VEGDRPPFTTGPSRGPAPSDRHDAEGKVSGRHHHPQDRDGLLSHGPVQLAAGGRADHDAGDLQVAARRRVDIHRRGERSGKRDDGSLVEDVRAIIFRAHPLRARRVALTSDQSVCERLASGSTSE
jgi:hypothetical protein